MADIYISHENGNKLWYGNGAKQETTDRPESKISMRISTSDPILQQEYKQPQVSRSFTNSSGYSSASVKSSISEPDSTKQKQNKTNKHTFPNDFENTSSSDITVTEVAEVCSTVVDSSSVNSVIKLKEKDHNSSNCVLIHHNSNLLTPPLTKLSNDSEIFAENPQWDNLLLGKTQQGLTTPTNLTIPTITITPPSPPGSRTTFIIPTIMITPPTPPEMIHDINKSTSIRDAKISDKVVHEVIESLKELVSENVNTTGRVNAETTPPTPNNSTISLSDKYRINAVVLDQDDEDDSYSGLSYKKGSLTNLYHVEEEAAATCAAVRPEVPCHDTKASYKAKNRSFNKIQFNNILSEVDAATNDGSHWHLHSKRRKKLTKAKIRLRKIRKAMKKTTYRIFRVGVVFLEDQAKFGPLSFMFCTYHRTHTNF